MDCWLCLKIVEPVILVTLRANVYYRSCLHHIRPYATVTESVRYLPKCSLELLKTIGNTIVCLESTSAIHETLGMFDSLAFIDPLSVVAKVIPDCS